MICLSRRRGRGCSVSPGLVVTATCSHSSGLTSCRCRSGRSCRSGYSAKKEIYITENSGLFLGESQHNQFIADAKLYAWSLGLGLGLPWISWRSIPCIEVQWILKGGASVFKPLTSNSSRLFPSRSSLPVQWWVKLEDISFAILLKRRPCHRLLRKSLALDSLLVFCSSKAAGKA